MSKRKYLKDGSVAEWFIQKQILDWLKETGLLHWRQNSGNVFAGNRRVKLGESGLPDIIVVVPPGGHLLGLEVKSAKGTLRKDQRAFRDTCKRVGASYEVVRTLKQAMDAVANSIGGQSAWLSLGMRSGSWRAV